MQVTTYTNVKGLEGFTINCIFEGTKQDDESLIKDVAQIIVNNIRKKVKTNEKA